jgi:hypothetical protein
MLWLLSSQWVWRNIRWSIATKYAVRRGCRLDSAGSIWSPVADCCKHGNGPLGSVRFLSSIPPRDVSSSIHLRPVAVMCKHKMNLAVKRRVNVLTSEATISLSRRTMVHAFAYTTFIINHLQIFIISHTFGNKDKGNKFVITISYRHKTWKRKWKRSTNKCVSMKDELSGQGRKQ